MQKFFLGLHRTDRAWQFDRTFISANRLWDRGPRDLVGSDEWVMDSGAFTEIDKHGGYRFGADAYAEVIRRYAKEQGLLAAVAQDFMCETAVCAKLLGIPEKDLTPAMHAAQVLKHQEQTIARYDDLMACDVGGVTIIPVLQGFYPADYVRHLRAYGSRIGEGAWVGVGSVCKRQGDPEAIVAVLKAIKDERPDLRLHGFGVKLTALKDPRVVELLYSADSMAWSFAQRKRKGDANALVNARQFEFEVLRAIGQEPGFWLSHFLKDDPSRLTEWADAVNSKAADRRARNQEWNATWKRIQEQA